MKLGEALSLRARQAQQMNSLKGRIINSASYQEGSDPAEDPKVLIDEYLGISGEHKVLVSQIAHTNANTPVDDDGKSLLNLLQEREELIRERNLIQVSADAGASSHGGMRYMRTEIKYVTSLDVPALRTRVDEVSETIRVLDAKIQEINWSVDLL